MMESEQNVGANATIFEQASGAAYYLAMNTFLHDNFGDFALWPGIAPLKDVDALGSVDALRSIKIVNAYIVAFFDKHLKAKSATLLDGQSKDFIEVKFTSK